MAALVLGPNLAQAKVHALVVGIDRYESLPALKGAVSDARDISQALARQGIDDKTVLLEGEATREAIQAAWQGMMERASPGDTLLWTHAGHGGLEPARVPGSESSGQDSVLLLGGFTSSGAGTRQRIIDDEIHDWFKAAVDRNLKVILVADACHAGTPTRSIRPDIGSEGARYSTYKVDQDQLVLPPPGPGGVGDPEDLPGVSSLGASQDKQVVKEVLLRQPDGSLQYRGVFSYAFARALDGLADADHDGQLTRDELHTYLRENVRTYKEGAQTPNLLPSDRQDEALFTLRKPAAPSDTPPTAAALPTVTLALRDPAAQGLATGLTGVVIAPQSQLHLDGAKHALYSDSGDALAYAINDTAALQRAVDKWRQLEHLKAHRTDARLAMRAEPDDRLYPAGMAFGYRIDGRRFPHLLVFNLAGDGTAQLLYPRPDKGDDTPPPVDKPVDFRVAASEPFGADHVIAVAAAEPLDALVMLARQQDGRPAAPLIDALVRTTAQGAYQVGIQPLYTEPPR